MTAHDYSLAGLNKFLDYALTKGLMKKETASGRKRAANQILGILEEHEQADLRSVDLEATARRFANLQGSKFKPSSLQVYVSRTNSAIQDFISYVDDPINFKSSVNTRDSSNGTASKKKIKQKQQDTGIEKDKIPPEEDRSGGKDGGGAHHGHPETLVFPIPVRPGLVVKISNIPSDLTEAEASKIAAVVKALAVTSE